MDSHYKTLGVSINANLDEIKRAYRKLSYQYHPDKNNGDANKAEMFTKINEAYESLNDDTRRQQYDFEQNMMGSNVDINHEMEHIMNQFMGGFLNKRGHHKTKSHSMNMDPFIHLFHNMTPDMEEVVFVNQPKEHTSQKEATPLPDDLHENIEITYSEAYHGCCKPILIKRMNQTNMSITEEEEKIYVDIPKGIDNFEIIELKGKGNRIEQHQSDLKIHICLKNHEQFERQGLNLILKHTITFKESVLGFSFVIHHINGNQLKMNHTRGNSISNGERKNIRGMGFERDETKKGDLILEFIVKMPNDFTDEQLELIEKHF